MCARAHRCICTCILCMHFNTLPLQFFGPRRDNQTHHRQCTKRRYGEVRNFDVNTVVNMSMIAASKLTRRDLIGKKDAMKREFPLFYHCYHHHHVVNLNVGQVRDGSGRHLAGFGLCRLGSCGLRVASDLKSQISPLTQS